MIKKNISIAFCLLFFFSFCINAQIIREDAISGNWLTEKNEAKINVYKDKDGKYYGKIYWLKVSNDENGKPKKDIKNKHENLRNRSLIGVLILSGMQFNSSDKVWENGRVYKPDYGHDADCIIYYIDENTIKVKGYMGLKWISESQIWKRVI